MKKRRGPVTIDFNKAAYLVVNPHLPYFRAEGWNFEGSMLSKTAGSLLQTVISFLFDHVVNQPNARLRANIIAPWLALNDFYFIQ